MQSVCGNDEDCNKLKSIFVENKGYDQIKLKLMTLETDLKNSQKLIQISIQ